jgi:hypothetical protein
MSITLSLLLDTLCLCLCYCYTALPALLCCVVDSNNSNAVVMLVLPQVIVCVHSDYDTDVQVKRQT